MTSEDNTNNEQQDSSVNDASDQGIGQNAYNYSQYGSNMDATTSDNSNQDASQNEQADSANEASVEPTTFHDVSPNQEVAQAETPAEAEAGPQEFSKQPVVAGDNIQAESALEAAALAEAIPSSSQSPDQVVTSLHHKSPLKMLLKIFAVIVLIAAASFVSYTLGKSHQTKAVAVTTTSTVKTISLPPSAIVTAACVPGRGKQYIIPKDIPEGPIYDVENNKVIAIEYVFGVHQILTNSTLFSTTLLALSRNYPVDHFSFLPVAPQPGDTDQYVHLIMSVVSPKVSDAITCQGVPNSAATTSTGTIPATAATPAATTTKTN
jgi:hypothetical protein